VAAKPGVFDLRTPRDLLTKARHELDRMRADPTDTYAAFNFFVTARHIPDWLHPTDHQLVEKQFKTHVELRICRHIADGAKHFQLTDTRHKQVKESLKTHDAWGGVFGNSWGGSWGRDALVIELDSADPDTMQFGNRIDAIDLAERVFRTLLSIVP
jgi:hypothetical protein